MNERPPSASVAAIAPPPAPEPTTTTSADSTRSALPASSKLTTLSEAMSPQALGAHQRDMLVDVVAERGGDALVRIIGEQADAFDRLDQIAANRRARVGPLGDVAAAPL